MIHELSFRPMPHKYATFDAMFHQLAHNPLNPQFDIMEKFAFTNNISIKIDRLVQKKLSHCALDLTNRIPYDPPSPKKTRWVSLPSLGHFSGLLNYILRSFGFRHAYYDLFSLRKLLVNLKGEIPQYEKRTRRKIPSLWYQRSQKATGSRTARNHPPLKQ